ncbi:MAG: AAA family ATPase, partial [Eubacteriales bacterium]|nr:AAA family ATPase [Eubacteriales bacterium]
GVGASRVRDLFDQAKRSSPSIVFIDEIDAVGRHRGAGLGGGHDEREQTLNQLLVEMDGFATNEGVIVMAATNRRDILDPALLRPGRFDRQVTVNYPDLNGRVAILKVHSRGKPLGTDVNLENIAKRTPFATGADLENVMNEAAIVAARYKKREISQSHLVEAVERVQMGPEKKSHKVLEEDKRIVAYHEAGHAVVGHYLPECDEVHTVTIVPRGGAGGFTLSLPDKEFDMQSRTKMLQMVSMMLGGHAAIKIIENDVYTGAQSDLKKATEVIRTMVTKLGMSDALGTVYLGNDQEVFVGMEFGQSREYSEDYARKIDHEVASLLEKSYQVALKTLKDHIDKLHGLANLLIERETVTREEFLAFMDAKVPELIPAQA